ncbi:MAG: hypothetical protein ACI3ZC_00690 [Candidatus Cryptobacteroides sp.]
MARALRNIVEALVISVFFLTPAPAGAMQSDMWYDAGEEEGWNDVLRHYASLCDSCLKLKPLIASGVPVSKDYAESLVTRFISLNRELREALPGLTPEEQGTFIRITEKFLELSGSGKVRGQTDGDLPPVDCPSDSLKNEISLKNQSISYPPPTA